MFRILWRLYIEEMLGKETIAKQPVLFAWASMCILGGIAATILLIIGPLVLRLIDKPNLIPFQYFGILSGIIAVFIAIACWRFAANLPSPDP